MLQARSLYWGLIGLEVADRLAEPNRGITASEGEGQAAGTEPAATPPHRWAPPALHSRSAPHRSLLPLLLLLGGRLEQKWVAGVNSYGIAVTARLRDIILVDTSPGGLIHSLSQDTLPSPLPIGSLFQSITAAPLPTYTTPVSTPVSTTVSRQITAPDLKRRAQGFVTTRRHRTVVPKSYARGSSF